MGTINISPAEGIVMKDFNDGNSVQVRVTVSPNEERQYEKGQTVTLVYEGNEAQAKIVSDPLVVVPKTDDGKETLSLIVEKSNG